MPPRIAKIRVPGPPVEGSSYGLMFNDVLRKLITTRDEIASYYQSNVEAARITGSSVETVQILVFWLYR